MKIYEARNMKAMVLKEIASLKINKSPLLLENVKDPIPEKNEILVKVSCCGVCHTELDEIEGRTPPLKLPIILGHQVVGTVADKGKIVSKFKTGDRIGIAWINSACGICRYCKSGNENLCPDFKATGRDVNGGYAEYMTVREEFAHRIPKHFTDLDAAPLLCAGAIGYRSLILANLGNGQNLGLTGFGASGHLVLKMVKHRFPKSNVFVFARSTEEQNFARELGAAWAGNTEDRSPEQLDSIIDTTPVWKPVVESLKNLRSGGRLVINAIRKEEIDKEYLTRINYESDLWMEKEIKSVANVTRLDVSEFLKLAADIRIKPEVQTYPLESANEAIADIKNGNTKGAKVLTV
jgi:alcohol dehydrogenase, propanol-preferring